MLPTPVVFILQVGWFSLAFGVVVRMVLWPWSASLAPHHRAALWIAPQMSRVLGLGLMVPKLAPGMPAEMAVPTAIGDSTTAVLALAAFVTLVRGHRLGPTLGWLCMIIGVADGLHALATAARLQVADALAGQWYVPALNVPLMAVCHVAGVVALARLRTPAQTP